MNNIYALGGALLAVAVICVTAWILYRYSMLAHPQREDLPWYETWKRLIIVAIGAFIFGVLSRPMPIVWAVLTSWSWSVVLALHFPRIRERPWSLRIEQFSIWIAWMIGGMSFGAPVTDRICDSDWLGARVGFMRTVSERGSKRSARLTLAVLLGSQPEIS